MPSLYRIQLQDELRPAFRAGWQTLEVTHGRKWIHLRNPIRKRRKKITRALWELISKNAILLKELNL